MPRVEIREIMVSHVWDDESEASTKIKKRHDETGAFVILDQEGQYVNIYPEDWPEIRKTIDSFLKS